MAFQQGPLPFAQDALEPYGMKAETLEYHYGKHHKAYVDNLNKLVEGTEFADKPLEEVIKASFKDPSKTAIFNNSGQAWNHDFYWNSLKPGGGGKPDSTVSDRIEKDFGSFDKFSEEFANAATTQFGSGWAWLVEDNGTLKVTKTPNAENPLVHDQKPLLTLDVWEHAYYIDFRNARPAFIKNYLEKLLNWDFVAKNLG